MIEYFGKSDTVSTIPFKRAKARGERSPDTGLAQDAGRAAPHRRHRAEIDLVRGASPIVSGRPDVHRPVASGS